LNSSALGPGFCTNDEAFTGAEHRAAKLPSSLVQLQRHGPLPVTDEAVPFLHRLPVGALLAATSFDEPQASATAGGLGSGEAPGSDGRDRDMTLTSTSIVELPRTLEVPPSTLSEKKSRPCESLAGLYEKPVPYIVV
jgi:hypothetical protein